MEIELLLTEEQVMKILPEIRCLKNFLATLIISRFLSHGE